jgi:hypothetical protein
MPHRVDRRKSKHHHPVRMGFVVFSDDWGRHPSSSQHLFRRLARAHRVLWVETIGLRAPRLNRADVERALEIGRDWLRPDARSAASRPWCETPPQLHRFRPLMHPFYGTRVGAAVNDVWVAAQVRARARALGLSRPVLLTTVPNVAGLVGQLEERCAVYYCVDDFETWPGYAGGAIRALESKLVSRVDGLVATAEALVEKHGRPGLPILRLPHGVDASHFGAPADAPAALASVPRPRLLSLGLWDERVDAGLLAAVLDARPGWQLVMVGKRTAPPTPLDLHPRVLSVPPVSYAEVPCWLQHADVLLVPYVRNAQTDTINPLKLRELLATGRPVAATALPEIVRLGESLVSTGDGVDGFLAAIERALVLGDDAGTAAHRRAAVASETWEARVEALLGFIEGLTTAP